MGFTLYSFIMAVLWNSGFVVLLCFGRKGKSLSLSSIFALYGFSAVRMLFSIELPFAVVVKSNRIYPKIVSFFRCVIETTLRNVPVWQALLFVWASVSLFLIIRTVTQYVTVFRKLPFIQPTGDEQIQTVFERVQKEYGAPIKAVIIKDKSVSGVMSVGLIRKYILLPDYPLSDEKLFCALSHEYIHLKNNDQFVKLLLTLYCNVFWWNPFSYLLLKDLEQSLELKCDEHVLAEWSAMDKCTYMKTLIQDAAQQSGAPRMKAGTSLAGMDKDAQLKERFRMISNPPEKQRSKGVIAALLLIFLFSYTFVIQPNHEAPIEEIETGAGTYAIPEEEVYIHMNENGEYELVSPDVSAIISKEKAREYIEYGCRYEGEVYP